MGTNVLLGKAAFLLISATLISDVQRMIGRYPRELRADFVNEIKRPFEKGLLTVLHWLYNHGSFSKEQWESWENLPTWETSSPGPTTHDDFYMGSKSRIYDQQTWQTVASNHVGIWASVPQTIMIASEAGEDSVNLALLKGSALQPLPGAIEPSIWIRTWVPPSLRTICHQRERSLPFRSILASPENDINVGNTIRVG
ncbi:hypothetical protein BDU57DRAFT_177740 [Ampelomyces quisqualis]|uniref:Uncharacterized protein n=1 Tax=Ampelomyces quisqualis TaxID=50730 RepID=A0A6A5QSL6_AMPQU|nr:hypothetical protein BDU57DRAFT_177740 [Ampelomyces quisqualis]